MSDYRTFSENISHHLHRVIREVQKSPLPAETMLNHDGELRPELINLIKAIKDER